MAVLDGRRRMPDPECLAVTEEQLAVPVKSCEKIEPKKTRGYFLRRCRRPREPFDGAPQQPARKNGQAQGRELRKPGHVHVVDLALLDIKEIHVITDPRSEGQDQEHLASR